MERLDESLLTYLVNNTIRRCKCQFAASLLSRSVRQAILPDRILWRVVLSTEAPPSGTRGTFSQLNTNLRENLDLSTLTVRSLSLGGQVKQNRFSQITGPPVGFPKKLKKLTLAFIDLANFNIPPNIQSLSLIRAQCLSGFQYPLSLRFLFVAAPCGLSKQTISVPPDLLWFETENIPADTLIHFDPSIIPPQTWVIRQHRVFDAVPPTGVVTFKVEHCCAFNSAPEAHSGCLEFRIRTCKSFDQPCPEGIQIFGVNYCPSFTLASFKKSLKVSTLRIFQFEGYNIRIESGGKLRLDVLEELLQTSELSADEIFDFVRQVSFCTLQKAPDLLKRLKDASDLHQWLSDPNPPLFFARLPEATKRFLASGKSLGTQAIATKLLNEMIQDGTAPDHASLAILLR